jgi:hypothetical protein
VKKNKKDNALQRGLRLADRIGQWVEWAERSYGEEHVYISEELIQDLARFLVILEDIDKEIK